MRRLEESPYIAELPFRMKAKVFDPMIDMRIAAQNLKRAMKPCLVPVTKNKAGVVAASSSVPVQLPTNAQVLGRGFI